MAQVGNLKKKKFFLYTCVYAYVCGRLTVLSLCCGWLRLWKHIADFYYIYKGCICDENLMNCCCFVDGYSWWTTSKIFYMEFRLTTKTLNLWSPVEILLCSCSSTFTQVMLVLLVIVALCPVSAVGKRVGPVIERLLDLNPDWTVTIFWAPLGFTINWFAGVSIMWPAAANMLQCLLA
jgi:hypothetical protein